MCYDNTLYPFPREPVRYTDWEDLSNADDPRWVFELSRICFNHFAWTVAAKYLTRWEQFKVECGFKVLKPIRIVPYLIGTDTTHVTNDHYGVFVNGVRVYPPQEKSCSPTPPAS